ncbi:MAG: hypothetical protein AB3N28_12990 [Kordiimonas sp.]
MLKNLCKSLKLLDRLMPVLLFAFLLSFQSLINSGAAQNISFPELVGPDGRILTFADLCNAVDDTSKSKTHCKICVGGHNITPPILSAGVLLLTFSGNYLLPVANVWAIERPEATQARRRAPPEPNTF